MWLRQTIPRSPPTTSPCRIGSIYGYVSGAAGRIRAARHAVRIGPRAHRDWRRRLCPSLCFGHARPNRRGGRCQQGAPRLRVSGVRTVPARRRRSTLGNPGRSDPPTSRGAPADGERPDQHRDGNAPVPFGENRRSPRIGHLDQAGRGQPTTSCPPRSRPWHHRVTSVRPRDGSQLGASFQNTITQARESTGKGEVRCCYRG